MRTLVNNNVRACMLSHFSSVQLFETLWTVAYQAPLSIEFSRQENWSGLPCLHSGDLSHPGIKPTFPATPALQVDSLPLSHWKSHREILCVCVCVCVFFFFAMLYRVQGGWSITDKVEIRGHL